MDNTTERLVDYTLNLSFESMTPDVIRGCKDRLLDSLGCLAGAAKHPVSEKMCRLASRYSMDTNATIIATGKKVAPEIAAFANSTMIRVLDLSDSYRVKSGGHPSDHMGAPFAAAEIAGSTGKDLMAAIALGYEIYGSFTEAVDFNGQGWDQPLYCIVASALSAGKLLGLDREALGHAVALALVPNMPLYQTRTGELSEWKGCAGPNAARNGFFAALLAREGFAGPDAPFEGKFGLWDVVGNFTLPLEPGEPPKRIGYSNLKAFPICYQCQTATWTALDIRDQFTVEDVEKIFIETYLKSYMMTGSDPNRWAPKTRETADHSTPYVVATALIQGDVGESDFTDEALSTPEVLELMGRVEVVENKDLTAIHPGCVPCRMTVTLKDGREIKHELMYPKGHSKSPMTKREITDKFRRLYAVYGEAGNADAVIDAVETLDTMADIAPLFSTFRDGAKQLAAE